MNTALATKRKLIDIPPDVLNILSVKAAMDGTNVKKFIERLLLIEADKIESIADSQIYAGLLESDPEGKQCLSREERLRFEKQLGL